MTKLYFRKCRLGWILPIVALSCSFLQGADGYLPAGGPAPLRWQPLIAFRPELLKGLPPLATGEKMNPAVAAHLDAPTRPISTTELQSNVNVSQVALVDTNAPTLKVGDPDPLPGLPELLPQLFYPPSAMNRTSANLMPLNFIPPFPPQARSSSATYSTYKP